MSLLVTTNNPYKNKRGQIKIVTQFVRPIELQTIAIIQINIRPIFPEQASSEQPYLLLRCAFIRFINLNVAYANYDKSRNVAGCRSI